MWKVAALFTRISICSAPLFALENSDSHAEMIFWQPSAVLISARHGIALIPWAVDSPAANSFAVVSDASETQPMRTLAPLAARFFAIAAPIPGLD